MADQTGAAPRAGARGKWIGRVAVGVLLMGVVLLGMWFGLGQPRFWQAPLAALPSPTLEPSLTITTPVTVTASPVPSPSAAIELQQPINTGPSTFTSSELVTTTMAVPVAEWRNGPAQ